MKKKEKKIIIAIIICLIFCVSLIFFLNKSLKESNREYREENENEQGIGLNELEKVKDIDAFFMIDNCVKTYLDMVKNNDAAVVITYLSDNFIKSNNINEQNIFETIKSYNNYDSYRTVELYEKIDIETRFELYCVKGKIDGHFIYYIVGIDPNNETFDIYPIDEKNYNDSIKKSQNVIENSEKTIPKKTYNFYRRVNFSDEDLCRLYYTNYIKLMLTDIEDAYKMLDEDYKKLKFGNIENFNKYVESNKKAYELIYKVETDDSTSYNSHLDYYNFIQNNSQYQMKSFAVNNYDEYTQCLCGNITGSNYIFNIKYPGEYEAFLDSYTIDIPVFTEKYNKSTNENKVALNLEKIRGAMNTKDYRYVYEKLDETFRKKNFDSLQKFKDYIQNNFFEYNKFEYKEIKQEGKVYLASFDVTNLMETRETTSSYNVIMRLDENNKFVFSFSKQ